MVLSTANRRAYLPRGKKPENRCKILVPRDSDLTEGFRSVRVWNQFQGIRWFLFVSGPESLRIEWGEVIKKLFGSFSPWINSCNKSHAIHAKKFAASAAADVVKLWRLSVGVPPGQQFLWFSAPGTSTA